MKQKTLLIVLLLLVLTVLAACTGPAAPAAAPAEAPAATPAVAAAEESPSARFDPDNEKDSINWDKLDAATTILQQYPDLKGFYCNNDTMALGVVEAVKIAGKLGEVLVIGTDGIGNAHDSIRANEMTGTVDSFPELTGQVAVDV